MFGFYFLHINSIKKKIFENSIFPRPKSFFYLNFRYRDIYWQNLEEPNLPNPI